MRRPIIALLFLTASCGDPSVDLPDGGGFKLDSSVGPPPVPIVHLIPPSMPYKLVTISGSAQASRRIVVEGGQNPVATAILPDKTFCIDVPVPNPGTYTFHVYAQGTDGQLSEPAGPFPVSQNPSAPPIAGARTCTGADPAGCASAFEICGNNRDDNCNNLVDEDDPACATCTDDTFEENDDATAPRVDPGRYDNLQICPGDQDYFGIFLRENDQLDARLFFLQAEGNLDLHLIGLNWSTVLLRSTTFSDDESLTYTATATGEHKIHVFGTDVANSYVLELLVTEN